MPINAAIPRGLGFDQVNYWLEQPTLIEER